VPAPVKVAVMFNTIALGVFVVAFVFVHGSVATLDVKSPVAKVAV
jgi:hypothetical protein